MYSYRDILVIAIVAISVPVCFLRPFYGILMWTVFAFLNPHEFAWGAARQMSPALAVAIPTLLGGVIFAPAWRQLRCRETALAAILWLWFTITTFNSTHEPLFAPNAADTWYRWGMVSKILLMTLMTVLIVNTWERLRWFALTIAGSFGLIILKSLPFMIISGGGSRLYGPQNSMIADNNDFGLALNLVLPFFFFMAKDESRPWLKRLLGFLFVATIPAVMFTYSRGAFVGMLAVLVCMVLQAKRKAVLMLAAGFVLILAVLLAPQVWRDRIANTSSDQLDASARSRINAWTYSWRLANDFPLMGGGFDAFTPGLFARYAPNPNDVHGPHSVYFGVMAEHGFTGLALYLCLVASCFLSLRRTRRLARSLGDEQAFRYANIFGVAIIGFLVSGAFLGRAYFDFYFTIVGCVAILKQFVVREWIERRHELAEDESSDEMPEDLEATEAHA